MSEDSTVSTHIGDVGFRALSVLGDRIAELLVHTRLLLAAPHTLVLWVGVLAETTVAPLDAAVVEGDCRESSERKAAIAFCVI